MTFHRLFMLTSIPVFFGACTTVGAPPPLPSPPLPGPLAVERARLPAVEPVREPLPAVEVGERYAPSLITDQVVEIALESIGTPYVWGGTSEDGFDCSGLIQFAYAQVGILLPRVSRAQIGTGTPVAPDPGLLQPGDVLGFADGGSGRTDHVGLYVGDGAFIHSSSSGVKISDIADPFWRGRLVAARRIVG